MRAAPPDVAAPARTIPDGFQPLPPMGPYDLSVAPLFWRRSDSGFTIGMWIERRHCNTQNIFHGGALATVADMAMGCLVRAAHGGGVRSVTASMTIDFIGRAVAGDWIEARAELLRLGKRLAYVQCVVWRGKEAIARASASFAPVGTWNDIPNAHIFGPRDRSAG